jgi:hypothetical protein
MTTNADAFEAMADAVILDNALTRSEAGDVIEAFGPTMPGAAARNWIDAIAVLYESLGIINNATWASLRGEIINEGVVKTMALFNAMASGINALPESQPVNAAIALQSNEDIKATIPANIAIIEGNKTGGTNQQLDDAYDIAIAALNALDQNTP